MRDFPRPVVFASRCLGFAECRWNGATIPDAFVESLKPYVEFITACPEVEIGLGVPREPIRIIEDKGAQRLYQPATGRDVSEDMTRFSVRLLDSLGQVDGFVLKSRSPSCGFKDVKIYPREGKVAATTGKGRGFFGGAVIERFAHKAIEDEARLADFHIREWFLAKLFMLADFRAARSKGDMRDMVDFHSRNKLAIMAASQKALSALGKIVANHERLPAADVFAGYGDALGAALARAPGYKRNINVLMHAFGYFSDHLSKEEKGYFLETLERYRESRVPLSVPLHMMRGFIVRFKNDYLGNQTFFEPYPEDLITVTDSGKGRERRG